MSVQLHEVRGTARESEVRSFSAVTPLNENVHWLDLSVPNPLGVSMARHNFGA